MINEHPCTSQHIIESPGHGYPSVHNQFSQVTEDYTLHEYGVHYEKYSHADEDYAGYDRKIFNDHRGQASVGKQSQLNCQLIDKDDSPILRINQSSDNHPIKAISGEI